MKELRLTEQPGKSDASSSRTRWPHEATSKITRTAGGNFVGLGRSPAFRIHIRFTVEGLKVISREASVT